MCYLFFCEVFVEVKNHELFLLFALLDEIMIIYSMNYNFSTKIVGNFSTPTL